MSDERQRSIGTIVAVAAVALGLCCVGGFAVVTLFGFSPTALVDTVFDEPTPPGVVEAAVVAAPTLPTTDDLLGRWSWGVAGARNFRSKPDAAWVAPTGQGTEYELRPDGGCSVDAVVSRAAEDSACTVWVLRHTDECSWSVEGDELLVSLGEGPQYVRECSGDVQASTTSRRTVRYPAQRRGDVLMLGPQPAPMEFRRVP